MVHHNDPPSFGRTTPMDHRHWDITSDISIGPLRDRAWSLVHWCRLHVERPQHIIRLLSLLTQASNNNINNANITVDVEYE